MPELLRSGLVQGGWRSLPFTHFRDGITVHWILQGPADGPSVALLNYAAGARVPLHRHGGLETIVVLDGVQSDESGDYAAGSVILNPAGTTHSVWSEGGCVVLINWERPVVLLEGAS
jgi:anti-sigma factor ChrR (cupin superfamily)